jgi:hypothetical protein
VKTIIHKKLCAIIKPNCAEKLTARTLEEELLYVADRLSSLGNRIDQATFEERRRAVVELVKEIEVYSENIDGKKMPDVTITFRFNELCPNLEPPDTAVVIDDTPGRAVQYNSELEIARKWQMA